MDKVARRLELLRLEGLGFSQAEIVNELSVKLTCSKRVLYKDFDGLKALLTSVGERLPQELYRNSHLHYCRRLH